jgi:parallel beta-helix repeat protein
METRKMIAGITVVLLVAMCQSLWAVQYYVDKDGDNTTGLSWATAFHTIQQGINANNATVVDVDEDTYYESIDFNGKSVTVQSTDWDDWADEIKDTIIHGNGASKTVYFHNSDTSTLRGFTITGADDTGVRCSSSTSTIDHCLIKNISNSQSYDGAGMSISSGNATVTHCIFYNNEGDDGGGVYIYNCSPTISNCLFLENDADQGGAIRNDSASPTITNCTVFDNYADQGGGIYNGSNSDPTLTNNIFWDNLADSAGNEVYNSGTSDPTWSYSDIEGCGGSGGGWDSDCGNDGGGNIDDDPDFDDDSEPEGLDGYLGNSDDGLTLESTSPCIDTGTGCPGGTDLPGGTRCVNSTVDMGAYEYSS